VKCLGIIFEEKEDECAIGKCLYKLQGATQIAKKGNSWYLVLNSEERNRRKSSEDFLPI